MWIFTSTAALAAVLSLGLKPAEAQEEDKEEDEEDEQKFRSVSVLSDRSK